MIGCPRKLTHDQENEILRRYQSGVDTPVLAKDFGVSSQTILRTIVRLGGIVRSAVELNHRRVGENHHFFGKKRPGLGDIIRANRKEKYGPDHHSWKGGRYQMSNGYWMVYKPDHPRAIENGYVLEHRLVMEKVVGRFLTAEEVVHHKNGDRGDNNPENLMLFPNNAAHLEFEGKNHLRRKKQ